VERLEQVARLPVIIDNFAGRKIPAHHLSMKWELRAPVLQYEEGFKELTQEECDAAKAKQK
jgi:hypothetical protein